MKSGTGSKPKPSPYPPLTLTLNELKKSVKFGSHKFCLVVHVVHVLSYIYYYIWSVAYFMPHDSFLFNPRHTSTPNFNPKDEHISASMGAPCPSSPGGKKSNKRIGPIKIEHRKVSISRHLPESKSQFQREPLKAR